ncbi:hypothetical protein G6F65_020627 [Rhizopus arrhizus]|nr:hypothetical protein G6F65_020627 [Rhizopus arrhizus]
MPFPVLPVPAKAGPTGPGTGREVGSRKAPIWLRHDVAPRASVQSSRTGTQRSIGPGHAKATGPAKPTERVQPCAEGQDGRTSLHTSSASSRHAKNSPSTTPSSRCRSGVAMDSQRLAACSISTAVSMPTAARSILARD